MVDLINLNKAKKTRARAESKAQAAQNRVRFGQARSEKAANRLEANRARRDLDGKERKD